MFREPFTARVPISFGLRLRAADALQAWRVEAWSTLRGWAALAASAGCSIPVATQPVPPAPPPPVVEQERPATTVLPPSVPPDPCCTALRGSCPAVPACEVVRECREVDCCRLGTYAHAPPREWANCDGGWR